MTKGDWGKVKAFFALDFNGVIVTSFKLVEGVNGLFVGFPSEKKVDENGDPVYKDTVMATREKRQEILAIAMKSYDGIGDPIDFANNPVKTEPASKKEEPAEAYDDGIPF
jgi:DNA-binding cell septation regulator SpoVG